MKALVTGSAGEIGRYLVSELLSRGSQVVGVDNFSNADHNDLTIKEIETTIKLDLCSVDKVRELDLLSFDVIFHLAAINGTANFYNMPLNVALANFDCPGLAVAVVSNCVRWRCD